MRPESPSKPNAQSLGAREGAAARERENRVSRCRTNFGWKEGKGTENLVDSYAEVSLWQAGGGKPKQSARPGRGDANRGPGPGGRS